LFLVGCKGKVLVIGYKLLEDVDLLFKISDLLLVIGRVLFASLDDLFDTLSLNLDSVEVLISTQ
jgi:hypothetical protein